MSKRKRPFSEFISDFRPPKKRLTWKQALVMIFEEYNPTVSLKLDEIQDDFFKLCQSEIVSTKSIGVDGKKGIELVIKPVLDHMVEENILEEQGEGYKILEITSKKGIPREMEMKSNTFLTKTTERKSYRQLYLDIIDSSNESFTTREIWNEFRERISSKDLDFVNLVCPSVGNVGNTLRSLFSMKKIKRRHIPGRIDSYEYCGLGKKFSERPIGTLGGVVEYILKKSDARRSTLEIIDEAKRLIKEGIINFNIMKIDIWRVGRVLERWEKRGIFGRSSFLGVKYYRYIDPNDRIESNSEESDDEDEDDDEREDMNTAEDWDLKSCVLRILKEKGSQSRKGIVDYIESQVKYGFINIVSSNTNNWKERIPGTLEELISANQIYRNKIKSLRRIRTNRLQSKGQQKEPKKRFKSCYVTRYTLSPPKVQKLEFESSMNPSNSSTTNYVLPQQPQPFTTNNNHNISSIKVHPPPPPPPNGHNESVEIPTFYASLERKRMISIVDHLNKLPELTIRSKPVLPFYRVLRSITVTQNHETEIVHLYVPGQETGARKIMKTVHVTKENFISKNEDILRLRKMKINGTLMLEEIYSHDHQTFMMYEHLPTPLIDLREMKDKRTKEKIIRRIVENISSLVSHGIQPFIAFDTVFFSIDKEITNGMMNRSDEDDINIEVKFLLWNNFKFANLGYGDDIEFVSHMTRFLNGFLIVGGLGKCKQSGYSTLNSLLDDVLGQIKC